MLTNARAHTNIHTGMDMISADTRPDLVDCSLWLSSARCLLELCVWLRALDRKCTYSCIRVCSYPSFHS